MPFFNVLADAIDSAVPSRRKPKPAPKPTTQPAVAAKPGVPTRSQDPAIKAEIDRRMAAQKPIRR